MKSIRASLIPALAALLLVAFPLIVRGEVTLAQMQSLVDSHGVKPLVELMLDARNGQVSIETGGQVKEVWGRPRMDLVTARSLCDDANKAGLELETLTARLESDSSARRSAERRLAGDGPASAMVPLASLDPDLKVWSPRRRWTVKTLIDDADRYRDSWSEDLNALRQKEAYRRNMRVERILISWQSLYGSSDLREVEKRLLRDAREAMNACQRLNRRKDHRIWKEMNCDAATRRGALRVKGRLRNQLRKPFDDFEAAVKPSLQGAAGSRRLRLY